MILTTLLLLAFVPQTAQDTLKNSQDMLNLATAREPLTHTAIVHAPVKEVWKAFTTTEGIKSWMVASGVVDLRVGGYLRTSYQPNSKLDGPDVIENRILAFDPERMLTIQNVRAPEKFPLKKAIEKVWTVIYFDAMGDKTRVTTRMIGFDGSKDSTSLRRFFLDGNQQELDALVKRFAKQ